MTRLQKKCLVVAAGTHLLLLVVLLCSGFIRPRPKVDNADILDVIPAKLIDALQSSGVRGAQPPPPTPVVQPQQPPTPTPTPPPPKPEVKPEPVKPVEPEPQPEKLHADLPVPEKPKPHKIEVDLTPVVHKKTPKTDNHEAEAKAEAKAAAAAEKAAQRDREARARAIASIARNIKDNASSSTTVDMPGDSTVAYANYASVVKSVYTQAWTLPDDVSSDDANVKVSVTIANDGRVISAHIIDRSGDSNVDRSVQNTLDRVTEIAPFPDGSTDKERTYIINFNLKAKRQMLG